MSEKNRDKLPIKANVEIKAVLCFDTPIIGTGPHGEYRIYALYFDGTEYNWFASEQAHQIIRERRYKKGDEISILKDEYEDGKHRYIINGESHDDVFGGAPVPGEAAGQGDPPALTARMDKMGIWAGDMEKRVKALEELAHNHAAEEPPGDDDIPF
ncbi:MAG: hypothetical protein J3T61_01430 [Candidatus Brocadiales bacterium]|nr:hypothetical protein [Candidatus Bathyanammoxibius sp.]